VIFIGHQVTQAAIVA